MMVRWKKFTDCLYRYRCQLCLIVFVLCIVFEINGSSIGMWDLYVPDASVKDTGILMGQNRPIRSDEWAVFSPMALSQYHNDFQRTNDLFRGTDTDVFMVYGQPVKDWSMIFRPFQIGYLFFRPARGLAFYWTGKMLALLLVSFEFGMFLTGRKRLLSLAYAFLTCFAPVVQWWFSVNAFPDMLIYGQGIVLCIRQYMMSQKYLKRAACAAGLFLLCGAYALVLYPAWQVPFFYVFASLAIWTIFRNFSSFSFSWKKDVPILACAFLLLVFCLGAVIFRSWGTIQAVMHSAYPGQRLETGGMGIDRLFQYIGNIFLPFTDEEVPGNVCEMALFYDFSPLGLLFFLYFLHRRENTDSLSLVLVSVNVFLGCYTVLGFPALLSKITLLSTSPPYRTLAAVSYTNLLLFIRSSAQLTGKIKGAHRAAVCCAACITAAAMVYWSRRMLYTSYYTNPMYWICIAVTAVMFISACLHPKVLFIASLILSLAIGATVNPVRTGTGILYENKVGRAIAEVSSRSDGKWLVVSEHWPVGNYPPIFGASTINTTQTYPQSELWAVLDPEGKYADVYNRYAHCEICLTDDPSSVQLLYTDYVRINLNIGDIQKTGAAFILSKQELTELSNDKIRFNKVFADPDVSYRIYELEYP